MELNLEKPEVIFAILVILFFIYKIFFEKTYQEVDTPTTKTYIEYYNIDTKDVETKTVDFYNLFISKINELKKKICNCKD